MRILWLSHLIPYPPKGGILQRAYFLLEEIAKIHEVDLIAFNQPDLIKPLYPTLAEGISDAGKVLGRICKNIRFTEIELEQKRFGKHRLALKCLFTKDPYTVSWLKSPAFREAVEEFIGTYEYDLIHIDSISLTPYMDLLGRHPTILDHHNIESHMLLRRAEKENNFLKKWYYRQEGLRLERVEKQVCNKVSANITCSWLDAERLRVIAPDCVAREIPNGVDTDYFKPDYSAQQEKTLLFIGTLSWYPNIEAVRFIAGELWPALVTAIPDIRFDIVGANPPEDLVEAARSYDNFHVHGFVDDVRPYFDKASVFVCPIRDGGGTKLKILDAFSMGKAVVAHPVACEGIDVTDGENVFLAESVSEYLDHITRLVSDSSTRREAGGKARTLVENNYTFSSIGKQLSEIYEHCAAGLPV